MKRLFFWVMLSCFLISFNKSPSRVLIFLKEASPQLEYMLTNEVAKMSELLKEAGYEVKTASLSGKILQAGSVSLMPDYMLSDVKADDYAAFVFPCMVSDFAGDEAVNFAKEAVFKGKPVAAQAGGVVILARAGALDGKKYALIADAGDNPDFKGGIYSGTGVVRDGIIITSGVCPWIAKETGLQDGTPALMQTLSDVLNGKIPASSEIRNKPDADSADSVCSIAGKNYLRGEFIPKISGTWKAVEAWVHEANLLGERNFYFSFLLNDSIKISEPEKSWHSDGTWSIDLNENMIQWDMPDANESFKGRYDIVDGQLLISGNGFIGASESICLRLKKQ